MRWSPLRDGTEGYISAISDTPNIDRNHYNFIQQPTLWFGDSAYRDRSGRGSQRQGDSKPNDCQRLGMPYPHMLSSDCINKLSSVLRSWDLVQSVERLQAQTNTTTPERPAKPQHPRFATEILQGRSALTCMVASSTMSNPSFTKRTNKRRTSPLNCCGE